jgi:hypothetical protein
MKEPILPPTQYERVGPAITVTMSPGITPPLAVNHPPSLAHSNPCSRVALSSAKDSGYYLVGLLGPCSWLFVGITWGANSVLAASLVKARTAGVDPALLPKLSDIDEPPDLSLWQTTKSFGMSVRDFCNPI